MPPHSCPDCGEPLVEQVIGQVDWFICTAVPSHNFTPSELKRLEAS